MYNIKENDYHNMKIKLHGVPSATVFLAVSLGVREILFI